MCVRDQPSALDPQRPQSQDAKTEHILFAGLQVSIATLSLRELLEVCKACGVQRNGAMERRMLEEEIMHRLNVAPDGDALASLNTECLRVILTMRAIPFQDCMEKQDRVCGRHRGARASFKLPVAVLSRR